MLVADDHPVVRQGIKQILAGTSDLVAAAEAADAGETLEAASTGLCDAVLLDLAMPGADGLDLIKALRERRPSLPILVLSMYPEEQFAVRALRAGASGYLSKCSTRADLVAALRSVRGGGKYISPGVAEELARAAGVGRSALPHESLSDREYQVLRAMASGRALAEIASELSLSVKTVSTYRSRLMEKMKMRTNAQLTSYAFRHHLVE